METLETRQRLANSIKTLQSQGDTESINRLVSAYKNKYQSQQLKQPTFVGGIVRDITKPLATLGVSAMRAGAGIGALARRERVPQDFFTKPTPTKYWGDVKPLQTPRQALGVGAQLASYLPVTGALKTIPMAFKGQLARAAKIGAKEGAFGGGLFMGGRAIEEGKPIGQVAKETGIGVLGGGVGGAVLGPIIPLTAKVIPVGYKLAAKTFAQTPEKAMQRFYKRPTEGAMALKRAVEDETMIFKITDVAQQAVDDIQSQKTINFQEGLRKLLPEQSVVDQQKVFGKMQEIIENKRLVRNGISNTDQVLPSEAEARTIDRVIDRINSQKDFSVQGWLDLKDFIQNAYSPTASRNFNSITTALSNSVREAMPIAVKQLLKESQADEMLLQQLRKEFGMMRGQQGVDIATEGGQVVLRENTQRVINALRRAFSDKSQTGAILLQQMEKRGGQEILDDIAAQFFVSWLPPAGLQTLVGLSAGSIATILGGIGMATKALPIALLTGSPRIVGKIALAAGKTRKGLTGLFKGLKKQFTPTEPKQIPFLPKKKILSKQGQALYGGVAGFEREKETGEWRFSPKKAALGVGIMGGLRTKMGQELSEKAINFFKSWITKDVGEKTSSIPQDILSEVSKYKPKKSVRLYRGITKGQKEIDQNPTSWTYNKDVAQEHTYGEGKVVSKVFKPEDILTDFTEMPSSVQQKLGAFEEEAEVIVRGKKNIPIFAKVITPELQSLAQEARIVLEKPRVTGKGVDNYYATPYKNVYIHEFVYPDGKKVFSAGKVSGGKNYQLSQEGGKLGGIPTYESPSEKTFEGALERAKNISTGKLLKGQRLRETGTNVALFNEIETNLNQAVKGVKEIKPKPILKPEPSVKNPFEEVWHPDKIEQIGWRYENKKWIFDNRAQEKIREVSNYIKSKDPSAQVYLYGSWTNGQALKGSDFDFYIKSNILTEKELNKIKNIDSVVSELPISRVKEEHEYLDIINPLKINKIKGEILQGKPLKPALAIKHIDKTGTWYEIQDGHHSIQAATELGVENYPVQITRTIKKNLPINLKKL